MYPDKLLAYLIDSSLVNWTHPSHPDLFLFILATQMLYLLGSTKKSDQNASADPTMRFLGAKKSMDSETPNLETFSFSFS